MESCLQQDNLQLSDLPEACTCSSILELHVSIIKGPGRCSQYVQPRAKIPQVWPSTIFECTRALLKPRISSDWTPLHIAVWNHDFAETRLLASPSSVNREDNQGWAPVHLACAAESSFIFLSHQISRRRSEQFLSPSGKLPREVHYYSEDEENAAAMRILEILLEHQPDLGGSELSVHHSRFPTPLHCAANSGWLSHARALVGAGALVYTGPHCSPLCWADGGSGGNQPVAVFLREILSEGGLAMIEDDHAQEKRKADNDEELSVTADRADSHLQPGARRAILARILERNREAASAARLLLPFPATEIKISSNGLCQICSGMSFKELCRPRGYVHHHVARMQESANLWHCRFCKVINEVLREDNQLDQHDRSRIIMGISNGNKGHRGVCTDPPILRTLEFKISAGCTCSSGRSTAPYSRGTLDFSGCVGRCVTVEVLVSIFSENGAYNVFLVIYRDIVLISNRKNVHDTTRHRSNSVQGQDLCPTGPLLVNSDGNRNRLRSTFRFKCKNYATMD